MARAKAEPFPPAVPDSTRIQAPTTNGGPRRRRASSNLGADPRGDTGATAIATSNISQEEDLLVAETNAAKRNGRSTRSKRRRDKSWFSQWKRISLRHTWLNPLILVLIILAGYYISPGEHNPLHAAIFLSYKNPPLNERTNTLPAHIGNPVQYGKGPKDFAFVAFYTVVLSFTREFLMQRLIRPIAIAAGIRGKDKQSRFMEQFYTAIYFAIFGPYGMFVMSRTPVWYFNTAGMFEGFPHRAHEGYFKAWYLLEGAYWAQQALVMLLLLEKPRKDFKELVLHHIITLALIALSYRFHFTYMGVAVYITHDISDFFLATSKVLNYLDWWITPFYFIFFIGVWAYMRHYINLTILAALLPGGNFSTIGPFEMDWAAQQYKCLLSQVITFGLLAALQAVNLFWFALIIRILLRYLFKGEQRDERSDDEEEEEEEVAEVHAASKQGSLTSPQVLLNGEPVSANEHITSGVETRGGADVTKRK